MAGSCSSVNGYPSVSYGRTSLWGVWIHFFGLSERIDTRVFADRDSWHPPPDLHSGKLFRRLTMGEEGAGERNKALQDAIIARRKKRINAHLWCINGV